LADKKGFGRMVALKNARMEDLQLSEALEVPKRVDLNGDAILTARGLIVSFGD
jgi:acetoacetate decarboxylase